MKKIFIVAASLLIVACSNSTNVEKTTNSIELTNIAETEMVDFSNSKSDKDLQIEKICNIVEAMDFTINQPDINISQEQDSFYKGAYLKILKSEIPTINSEGKTEYFRDLYKAGKEFDELNESYSYYYNDLDGDGLPELGVKSLGYTYILKHMPQRNDFEVLFQGQSMYYTILGAKQLAYHDGLHAGVIRDRYIILNDKNEWEIILDLEQGTEPARPYYGVGVLGSEKVDVGEKNWEKITSPFFKATEQAIPSKSLEEIFGKTLKQS